MLSRFLRPLSLAPLFACILLLAACRPASDDAQAPGDVAGEETATPVAEWALAIHGGAGVIPKDMDEEAQALYRRDLAAALDHGRGRLADGAPALDVVQEVVRILEDSPRFNAGKGAVFNAAGENELDAAIMDGSDHSCGAVAGVRTVRNPVNLARKVMEETRHVLLMGDGAEAFADEMGVERVNPEYYYTERRWQSLQKKLNAQKNGTVGAVARDVDGHLAAATSTGGLTAKRWGRVGDVPIVGAGTYADDATVAVSCTGTGEEFIRHAAAHTVSALVAYEDLDVEAAAQRVIHEILQPGDGGLIAVGHDGSIALVFSSPGMFRGAADANGRYEIGIWEDLETPPAVDEEPGEDGDEEEDGDQDGDQDSVGESES